MASARLARNRSQWSAGGIELYTDAPDPQRQLPLRLDTRRTGFAIRVAKVAVQPGGGTGVPVVIEEWTWSNGPAGAGTSIETAQSYGAGACEYGELVWLRRKGVAQPAGKLTELTLPATLSAYTSARLHRGRQYGVGSDLYLTTLTPYLVKIAGGLDTSTVELVDFSGQVGIAGADAATVGVAVFDGAGSSCLYVGCYATPIEELNGAVWTRGALGTERAWLAVPYWQIGAALATGGAAGTEGSAADRLVGVNNGATGFYHVAGDPKVAANWSALTPVGVGGTIFPLTGIAESNNVVWFASGLGVLGANALGHTPNLTKFVELMSEHDRWIVAEYWAGLVWLTTNQGLAAFSPDGSRVDFGQFLQFGAAAGTTPIYGRPRALCPTPAGMYVAYWNAATLTSYIGCLVHDDDGTFRWSMAEAVIHGQQVTYLQQVVGSDDVPRLFIGANETGLTPGLDPGLGRPHLYVQSLPASGDPEADVLSGGPFRAAQDWSLRLSRFGGAVPRTFRRWMVEADRLGTAYPDNTVEVDVATDGGAFAAQGTATTSPRWTATPGSAFVRGVSAQIKLVVHNAATAPVVIRSASAWHTPAPERVAVTTYPLVIGEKTTNQDPGSVLTRLNRAQRDQTPIAAVDHLGRQTEWIVEDVAEVASEEASGNGWTVHVDLTVSAVKALAYWDEDRWDEAVFS